ncbi:MAG: aminotransferase class III-fold pyridoxal phosphate-dependent enzyme, partial [Armatimonadota bacterium]|nr:aminotransferase class III-fold pyridoxal phosphate-dependent enzyme [Armatimonadota bacterium]
GLMIGVEFVDPDEGGAPNGAAVRRVLEGCLERGLLLYPAGPAGSVLRVIPPLVVSAGQLDEGLRIIEEVVHSLTP